MDPNLIGLVLLLNTETHIQEESHVRMKAEVRVMVMLPQGKESPRWPATYQTLKTSMEQILPHSPEGTNPANTFILDL